MSVGGSKQYRLTRARARGGKNRAYVNAASRAAADCRRSQSYQSPIPSPVRAES